jgi:hypothetical protein
VAEPVIVTGPLMLIEPDTVKLLFIVSVTVALFDKYKLAQVIAVLTLGCWEPEKTLIPNMETPI